ncbi:hypothetical protein GCM10028798_13940 [Humibacter antri]
MAEISNPGAGDGTEHAGGNRPGETPRAQPTPEGVNLLGTPQRVAENKDAARRRYAVGPFGQTWLWTIGIILSLTGLYKLLAGPALAATLPTAQGTVLSWITIPARTITYAPKISYQVSGMTYQFVAGSTVSTLTNAPKVATVSYVPFDPSVAIWNSGDWWSSFTDVYLMVTVILGLVLLCVAIYQRRIRHYWVAKNPDAGAAGHRVLIGAGMLLAVVGFAWLAAGYLSPASWFIPPDPNVIAAFIAAIGTALLATGLHYRRAGGR